MYVSNTDLSSVGNVFQIVCVILILLFTTTITCWIAYYLLTEFKPSEDGCLCYAFAILFALNTIVFNISDWISAFTLNKVGMTPISLIIMGISFAFGFITFFGTMFSGND